MTKLTINTEGEQSIIVTRRFAAPPADVYRAHVDSDLIQKWMLGPEGWVMTECINDYREGGSFRYAWSDGKGGDFHITGEYIAFEEGKRIEHVERMHMPDPTPDNHIVSTFDAVDGGTLLTLRMTLPDANVRAAVLASGMEHGMEACYVRIDEMFAEA